MRLLDHRSGRSTSSGTTVIACGVSMMGVSALVASRHDGRRASTRRGVANRVTQCATPQGVT
jgi:hypothetical protein